MNKMPQIQIECYQTYLSSIVVEVFHTMLGLDVEPRGDGDVAVAGSVTAAVHFAGEWRGAVLLQVSPELACSLCARLLGAELVPTFDDNVRDAMGELANMVAGNLKSVLPFRVALSMPTVVEGNDYALRICGKNLATLCRFSSTAGDFLWTLVEVVEE